MTVTVQLIEASHGVVNKITKLCTVSGKIPVYADDGDAARANGREVQGCKMQWKGRNLNVSVSGALGITHGSVTFASAAVSAVPPDAKPGCADVCGPQPLADSSGEIKVSGAPPLIEIQFESKPRFDIER